MRLNAVVNGLARKRSGIALLLGVSTVLTGIERLLRPRQGSPAPGAASLPRSSESTAGGAGQHRFSIRQTRSEVGFVYWVLQGFGCYESFSLHDTWEEAMAEANRRLANRQISAQEPSPKYVYVSAVAGG